jgi:hypothetical protein
VLQPVAPAVPSRALEAKIETLEKHVTERDAVIAWVADELIRQKGRREP